MNKFYELMLFSFAYKSCGNTPKQIFFFGDWSSPLFWLFTVWRGVHNLVVELDHTEWFSGVCPLRVSSFCGHSSVWVWWRLLAFSFTFDWTMRLNNYVSVLQNFLNHWISSVRITRAWVLMTSRVPFKRTEQKSRTQFCLLNFKTFPKTWKFPVKIIDDSVLQFPSISEKQFRNFKYIWDCWA